MIFIVQQYVSDKNVGSPIKYSQKYLYQISIPHQIPKHSTEDLDFLLHLPTSLPQAGVWHCSTLVLQRREKGNESKLSKWIQRINSRNDLNLTHFNSLCDTAHFQTVTRIIFAKACIKINIHVLKKWQEPKKKIS